MTEIKIEGNPLSCDKVCRGKAHLEGHMVRNC